MNAQEFFETSAQSANSLAILNGPRGFAYKIPNDLKPSELQKYCLNASFSNEILTISEDKKYLVLFPYGK